MLRKARSSVESQEQPLSAFCQKVLVMGFEVLPISNVPSYGQLDKQLFSHAVPMHKMRNNLYYAISKKNFKKKLPGIIYMTES